MESSLCHGTKRIGGRGVLLIGRTSRSTFNVNVPEERVPHGDINYFGHMTAFWRSLVIDLERDLGCCHASGLVD
jgi:hypothetical protein